jgi:hypothetical protein
MIDLTSIQHHPAMEEIVEVLCNKTQNTDKGFFRTEVAYFLGKMASSMRASVVTKDRGEIPVNIYALALASSGYGKGYSVNTMEQAFLGGFRKRFVEETLPTVADVNLWKLGKEKAHRDKLPTDQEGYDKVLAEYKRKGAYPFTFDSGTAPAVKQLRNKLLMAEAGSINLQIDEIGLNLLGNVEVLTLFLELYDQGMVKQKLTKNTNDNERDEEIDGKTPTNMLLFGTPSKLLDGGETEENFYSFLETGYARRCLFGWGIPGKKSFHTLSPTEIYHRLINPTNSSIVDKWAAHFASLADPIKFNWKMMVDDTVAIQLMGYKLWCEERAEKLSDHEEIQKAELMHRYFKALKLAGIYSFIDESSEVEMDHLSSAIKLVEESGDSFKLILNREKTYVKLAKYIATCGVEVTHADLHEALPFYKAGQAHRNEIMTLATAWGYKNHILVKKTFTDGIEFFKGETLEKTNLDEMILSYSNHWAYNFTPPENPAPFDKLHLLTGEPDLHWCNHLFKNEHRAEENVIPGFNCLVLDVDKGTPLITAMELLKDTKFFVHTTKRHTPEENRFRMVIPINYKLSLDADEYREFMNNVMDWLPFKIDEQANQRSRKWLTVQNSAYKYNHDGEVFDVLKFIPKTSKNEQYRAALKDIENLPNLERWFAQRIAVGNRNNNMLRYAMALVDSGMTFMEVEKAVYLFNEKLTQGLRKDELASTVMKSVAKRYVKGP